MATSVQCRPQERTLGMVMREVDEDLAMFLDPTHNSEELDQSLGSDVDYSLLSNGTSTRPADYFLNSENDKNDYDWLLSPPHTPSKPLPELEDQKISMCHITTDSTSTASDSKIETDPRTTASELKISIKQDSAQTANSVEGPSSHRLNSAGVPAASRRKSSSTANGRPSSSGGKKVTSTRSATPTGRRHSSGSNPSRASTPTSRATLPSVKPVARSSTPTSRPSVPAKSSSRSATPTGRPSVPAKSTSRSATPTSRSTVPTKSATPTCRPSAAASSIPIVSVSKTGTATSKKTSALSQGIFPTVKSRPGDSSINSKTLVQKRPASASRGRPSARPSTTNSTSDRKPRRKSCSPSSGRATNASYWSNASTMFSKSRGHINEKDDVNPVLIGTQMVERVVNMRKLAPPKQDDSSLSHDNPSKKSLSRENSGFGRSFSKKSLDMALRHMDIRRSVHGTLRPVQTRVSANGIQSKNKAGSVSDSPLGTSSSTSTEPSVNNSSNNMNWSEPEDDNL